MQRRLGFSFVEVLIVIAILAILAAIVFTTSGPSREKARQTVCMSNLQNLYKAFLLYEADTDHTDNHPILGVPLGPFRHHQAILPYLNKEILYCPDFPHDQRKQWLSSYTWVLYALPYGDPKDEMVQRQVRLQQGMIEELGTSFPIMRCHTHQREYYDRRETDTNPMMRNRFVIDLTAAGSVKGHWIEPLLP